MDPAGAGIGASCTRVLGGSVLVGAGRHGRGRGSRLGHAPGGGRATGRALPSGARPVRGLRASEGRAGVPRLRRRTEGATRRAVGASARDIELPRPRGTRYRGTANRGTANRGTANRGIR